MSKTIRMYTTAAVMLASGTYGFHITEGLSLLDSFYLSGITFTTIGYGDLPAPVTPVSYLHIYIHTIYINLIKHNITNKNINIYIYRW